MNKLTRFFQTLVGKLGYEIKKKERRGWNPPYLQSLTEANIIIDAGAAYGTPKLYEAFARRKFILIEPLSEYKEALEQWKSKIDCTIVSEAVGAKPGEALIQVDPRRLTLSSISKRSVLTKAEKEGERRVIPVTTIDQITNKLCNIDDRFVLKIDVEGMELDALKGSEQTLKRTELIIIETSVAKRFQNESDFHAIIDYLNTKGFRLFDILFLAYYKDWKGLMWTDLVFVRGSEKS